MKDLYGKVAVVTGSGSGIGRSIAHALASAGTSVVVADINLDTAESVRDEVIARGVDSLAVKVDVSDRASVGVLSDAAYDQFGRVDILVNNAGVTWRPLRPITQATLADWNFMLGVNLWGVIHGLDAFLPRMTKQPGEKHIVNTSSRAGVWPVMGHVPYSASKAAVSALSEAMADELVDEGFGVTILQPAMVRTNVVENSVRQRGDEEAGTGRTFKELKNPQMEMLNAGYIDAEPVGRMVCDAILRNQLYLNTHPISDEIIEWRTKLVYGPDTYGRA